jgi:hypothetical protein
MALPLLDVRPGLRIQIQTLPGSAYIRWWLPYCESCIFVPPDDSWRPDRTPLEPILAEIPEEDLILIKACLRQHAEERRVWFASQRTEPQPGVGLNRRRSHDA